MSYAGAPYMRYEAGVMANLYVKERYLLYAVTAVQASPMAVIRDVLLYSFPIVLPC